mmetsp:Transcript_25615/g.40133  ORF Transcript_25615/g.40133 Transcript_25615/m.40133 type:complete len:98 (+) Transcript_25615:264-557(+)
MVLLVLGATILKLSWWHGRPLYELLELDGLVSCIQIGKACSTTLSMSQQPTWWVALRIFSASLQGRTRTYRTLLLFPHLRFLDTVDIGYRFRFLHER